MKIYVRTEEGQEAAYSPQSALPRKLKAFLKVVDGKTRTQVYKTNLYSFGDVEGLLQSLEIAGLLKTTPQDTQQTRGSSNEVSSIRLPTFRERDWSVTRDPLEGGGDQRFHKTVLSSPALATAHS